MKISFNKSYIAGNECEYISELITNSNLSRDASYGEECKRWLERESGCNLALLTPSCTAALEMAAMLIDAKCGDEIIMPSYTFVSTANAFLLRGATPIFVDIREDTLNLDEKLLESAITNKTKAIVPVHYAGVACEMDEIGEIARENGLYVIEDAAQSILCAYKEKALGSIGDLGAYSFHETKNIASGEGGALLVNNESFIERSEIIREKGTNRSKFIRGELDKYTWVDIGSSYLLSEIVAAYLYAQLEEAKNINAKRLKLWSQYHELLEPLEKREILRRPIVPEECSHNGHIYYILLNNLDKREDLRKFLLKLGIQASFHYVPLHSSPFGKKVTKTNGNMNVTERISNSLLRLPLYPDLAEDSVQEIVEAIQRWAN